MFTRIDICHWCATTIHFIDPTKTLRYEWQHVATNTKRCPEGTTGTLVPLAAPTPRCPDCASTNVTTAQEAWVDRTRCGDCPYERVMSIGD